MSFCLTTIYSSPSHLTSVPLYFDVMTLSLTEEVPATIRILVLAEPKEALSVVEMEHLKDYINRGMTAGGVKG